MGLVVIAFALYFILQAINSFLALTNTPDPLRTIIVFVYCLVVGLYLLWQSGFIHH